MSNGRMASRYAKSILKLAEENGVLEKVKDDMEGFSSVCKENRDFALMLKSPIIPHLRKAELLRSIFKSKVNDLTLQAFDLMAKKNREGILDEMAKGFLDQYNLSKGLEQVAVTTCIEVSKEQRKAFEKIALAMTGKKPILEEHINKDIIGGYVLKTGDKQIDQSVVGQLKNIKLKLQTNEPVKRLNKRYNDGTYKT